MCYFTSLRINSISSSINGTHILQHQFIVIENELQIHLQIYNTKNKDPNRAVLFQFRLMASEECALLWIYKNTEGGE